MRFSFFKLRASIFFSSPERLRFATDALKQLSSTPVPLLPGDFAAQVWLPPLADLIAFQPPLSWRCCSVNSGVSSPPSSVATSVRFFVFRFFPHLLIGLFLGLSFGLLSQEFFCLPAELNFLCYSPYPAIRPRTPLSLCTPFSSQGPLFERNVL